MWISAPDLEQIVVPKFPPFVGRQNPDLTFSPPSPPYEEPLSFDPYEKPLPSSIPETNPFRRSMENPFWTPEQTNPFLDTSGPN